MRKLSLLAVLAVLLLAGAAPATAGADRPGPLGSPVYLALGDSVAAGIGATPKVTGYPELLAAALENGYNPRANKATPHAAVDFDVTNLAVPGATTTTLMAVQLPEALDLIAQRAGDHDPWNDVEVITVTIGGNDVVNPAVQTCVLDPTPTDCRATVEAALAAVEQRLGVILGGLVAAAGRHAEVVVTTYYNPVGSCVLSRLNPAAERIADVVLDGGTVPGVLTLEGGLNDVLREVAARTGAQVAELYGELGPGEFVGGEDCLHPNPAGHQTIADIAYATLAR